MFYAIDVRLQWQFGQEKNVCFFPFSFRVIISVSHLGHFISKPSYDHNFMFFSSSALFAFMYTIFVSSSKHQRRQCLESFLFQSVCFDYNDKERKYCVINSNRTLKMLKKYAFVVLNYKNFEQVMQPKQSWERQSSLCPQRSSWTQKRKATILLCDTSSKRN